MASVGSGLTPVAEIKGNGNRKNEDTDFIEVVSFAQARVNEIIEMKKLLQTFKGTKRVYQRLPRHLRRRTMGWDTKRMPKRLKQAAEREISEKTKQKQHGKRYYRRYKRRPKFLLMNYARRQVLHGFTFFLTEKATIPLVGNPHMARQTVQYEGIWGFKIPEYYRQRGIRASYKAAAHQCTLHDASYTCCIELTGSENDIIALLKLMSPLDCFLPFAAKMHLDGSRQGNFLFYEEGKYPFGLLCPYQFLWRQDTTGVAERMIWLWIHPISYDRVLLELQRVATQHAISVVIESRKEQLLKFELTGNTWFSILKKVIKLAEESVSMELGDTQVLTAASIWNDLKKFRTPSSVSDGVVLGLEVQDPRRFFPPKSTTAQNDFSSSVCVSSWMITWPKNVATNEMIWDKEKRELGLISSQAAINESRSLFALKKRHKQKGAALVPSVDPPQKVGILLINRQSTSNDFGGCDIILPAGWGMAFWHSLIYAGARAIGLNEQIKLSSEQNIPVFPRDYPDSVFYEDFIDNVHQESSNDFVKRPKAKRTNFAKLGVPHPFRPNWQYWMQDTNEVCVFRGKHLTPYLNLLQYAESTQINFKTGTSKYPHPTLQWIPKSSSTKLESLKAAIHPNNHDSNRALLRVVIKFAKRGFPVNNAMICAPGSSDFSHWKLEPKRLFDYQEPIHRAKPKKKKGSATEPDTPKPSRQIIGFVTAGDFSYSQGKGFATGFINAKSFEDLVLEAISNSNRNPTFVLIRNPTSRNYFPGFVALSDVSTE